MQIVQIPAAEWRSITRILRRYDADQQAQKSEWITTREFNKRTAHRFTADQLRYMREKTCPDIFKTKQDGRQYLISWTEYKALYD